MEGKPKLSQGKCQIFVEEICHDLHPEFPQGYEFPKKVLAMGKLRIGMMVNLADSHI